MTSTDSPEWKARRAACDRALADWIEAEALVGSLRRSCDAAADAAAERARAAAALRREGRRDAFAVGVADAAELLAHRAAAEQRRLEEAIRAEVLFRLRFASARAALEDPSARAAVEPSGEAQRVRRLSCG